MLAIQSGIANYLHIQGAVAFQLQWNFFCSPGIRKVLA